MVITSDGLFDHGEDLNDLAEWIHEYQPAGWPIDRVVASVCGACAYRVFRVVVDDGGQGAYRTCVRCNAMAYIANSGEYWMDDEAEPISCECGGDAFEVAVGFTLYADGDAVRAIGVGVRCATDGMLGSPAEWNIRDHPSLHLLQQV
ncbi:hypothetical protein AB0C02_14060 [Micromonospora sp. NPDC048999]|uniref:hypothetical protein n=1 Tax=Micromonospora sp. NPDC048999 TaxID=3155391 RepID=UPI00340295D6